MKKFYRNSGDFFSFSCHSYITLMTKYLIPLMKDSSSLYFLRRSCYLRSCSGKWSDLGACVCVFHLRCIFDSPWRFRTTGLTPQSLNYGLLLWQLSVHGIFLSCFLCALIKQIRGNVPFKKRQMRVNMETRVIFIILA